VACLAEKHTSFFNRIQNAVNSHDPHGEVDTNAETKGIHENAEVFEERTENSFRFLQVCLHPLLACSTMLRMVLWSSFPDEQYCACNV
jgi:hypothetical protein